MTKRDIRLTESDLPRFWSKVDIKGEDECWLWTRGTTHGYGIFMVRGVTLRAHRVALFLAEGDIPDGMVVDHICHVNACVNPRHLRAVTVQQNAENRIGAQVNSKSGIRGVVWRPKIKKWQAEATLWGRNHFGGYFDSIEAADLAARALRAELFTNSDDSMTGVVRA